MPPCLGTTALFRTTYCSSNLHSRRGSRLDLPPPGKQRGGASPAGSLHPRAGGGGGGAPGCPDSGPGGLPQQEGRGLVCPGLGEARSAGAGRSDDVHTGAAQGDGCTLLRAGRQSHAPQVTRYPVHTLTCTRTVQSGVFLGGLGMQRYCQFYGILVTKVSRRCQGHAGFKGQVLRAKSVFFSATVKQSERELGIAVTICPCVSIILCAPLAYTYLVVE